MTHTLPTRVLTLLVTGLAGLVVTGLVLACGPGTRDNPGDDAPTEPHLRVEPAQVTLYVQSPTPAEQIYTVIAVDADGAEQDVSTEAELSTNVTDLGSFTGNRFVSAADRAGRATITARWNQLVGTAELDIVLRQTIVDPSAPADAPDRFGGAQPGGAAPELVYPASGVIVPPNLGTMELHYRPGPGNNLFELVVTGTRVQLAIYFACTPLADGCVWEPSQAIWDTLALAGRGDTALTYHLRGLDGSAAAPTVGQSADQTLQFAGDDMFGGLYYWAAGNGAIMRYEFGRRGQTAERFLGVGQTGATTCVGCHALSRDGSKIAVGLDIPGPATVETYAVATRTKLWRAPMGGLPIPGATGGGNFFAFSPDNQWLLSSDGRSVVQRAADTGAGMTTVITSGSMPDWSADGARVVFARPATVPPFGGNPGVARASLHTVDATSWAGEQTLVPQVAGENNYYPSFSPDSGWVVFNRSLAADSFDAMDARLMAVAASGGPVYALAAASAATGGDSWPKWAPFVHSYAGGQLMWLTFSSRRPYGLRASGTSQLWMVGFDPARIQAGNDPSFVAFWLPFQDAASGNHIAQWVEEIRRQPCDDMGNECPGSEVCEAGVCVPPVIE
jgi:hypothetical protein